MDARTIYGLMKPYLDKLDHVEKESLSNLITSKPTRVIPNNHRKVFSLSKAKEKLKKFCRREMEREKMEEQFS